MKTKYEVFLSQSLFGVAVALAWTPIIPMLVEKFGIFLTLSIPAIAYSFSALSLYFTRIKGEARTIAFLGAFARGVSFLALFLEPKIATIVIGLCIGLVILLYWPTSNILYQRSLSIKSRGFFSSLVFASWGIARMIGPALGSWILKTMGVAPLAVIGFFLMLATGISLWEKKEKITLNARKKCFDKSLERVVMIDGFWQGIHFTVPMIVTYLYLRDFVNFGITFSALAVISIMVSLTLGYKSVNPNRREAVLAYSFGLAGITSIALGLSNNFVQWIMFLAILSSITQIKAPFLFALVADKGKSVECAMVRRELLMEIGRIFGIGISIAIFLAGGKIEWAYILSGLLMLIYSFKLKGYGLFGKARKKGKEILMIVQKI